MSPASVASRAGRRTLLLIAKFKEAARELGADEDEHHWEEKLKKVAKKPEEKAP